MGYIGKAPNFGVRNRYIYTASAGATSISGADDNSATLSFSDGAYVDVYLNGVLLKPTTDYNTSTANTIAGLSALNLNDIVEIIVYDLFNIADTVSATSGGTFNSDVNVKGDFDLISEATSGYHPTLKIDRQQSDTAADNDPLGQLDFSGRNDAAQQVNYFRMRGKIKDASDGTEDAQMAFKVMTGGTLTDRITLEGGQPIELEGGAVFNEGSADVDFRVESNGQTHKLFVDGGNDVVCLGLATPETIGGQMPGLQIEGTDYKGGQVSIWRNANDDAGAYLLLGKSRGTSLNSDTIVQDGDDVGIINFIGADGGDRAHPVASIRAAVDGTPGSNDMPGRIEFWTTADGGTTMAEKMRISANGDVDVQTGDIFFSTAGKGICLGVTSNTDSNTLDDYEEGTFTPAITGDATIGTISYDHRYGYYTKIGNKVTFEIYLAYGSSNSQAAQIFISGLPFTSSNDNSGRYASSVTLSAWHSGGCQDTFISPNANWINPNTTRVILSWNNQSAGVGVLDSNLAGHSGLAIISGNYKTDS